MVVAQQSMHAAVTIHGTGARGSSGMHVISQNDPAMWQNSGMALAPKALPWCLQYFQPSLSLFLFRPENHYL